MADEQKSKNALLIEKIEKRKNDWLDQISGNVIEKLKSDRLDQLNIAEAAALSYRERIVSEVFTIKGLLFKAGSELDEKYEKEYKKLIFSADIKLSPAERNKQLDNRLKDEKELVDLYERYIAFLGDCVKTIDSFAYAVKNRYDAIKWKEGF